MTHCKYQEEGLVLPPPGPESYIVDSTFVFVLTDADLEEKVEGMPLFIGKVAPEDFIAY